MFSWNAAGAAHRRVARRVLPRARREHRQVDPVAAVERQVLHLARIDVGADSVELTVSMSGASPVTVTDSCTVDGRQLQD